jgi:crotonobetainyl-CoA:carnitine CoA-transferase CaiB-like acyl-CoA transferase
MSGPLDGIKVIDLTTVVLGPFATQILGDLGADIIKVESPEGDSCRYLGAGKHPTLSGTAMTLLRNKRSIVLDLKQPAARDALKDLTATADVFIHNMRPPSAAKLGLTYDNLKQARPDLIYCAARGFGRDGAYADRAAYDDMIQGASGLADMIAQHSGEPGFVPSTICDKITGLTAVYAILAALYHRERTGEGQAVDVPMFETMVSFNLAEHFVGGVFDPPRTPPGYQRLLTAHRRPHKTSDGYVCILPYSNRNWRDFFTFSGRPQLIDDARFTDLTARTENVDTLYAIVAEAVAEKPTADWLAFCEQHAIPCQKLTRLDDLPNDVHLAGSGFFTTAEHPHEGRYLQTGIPTRFSKTPGAIRHHAPALGEQAEEILTEAGFDAGRIAHLKQSGALDGSS